jgi:hypothetical protein
MNATTASRQDVADYLIHACDVLDQAIQQLRIIAQNIGSDTNRKIQFRTPGHFEDGTASPDFASFRWGGRLWTFTPKQRSIVSVLCAEYKKGTPAVSQARLLSECESEGGHLRNLFSGHKAWGTLIVRSSALGGPRDCYQLADPATICG